MGGGLRLLGTCRPGAEAALVSVRKPGALYRADLTGPAGTVFVPVIDGNRGREPARCSSSDCKINEALQLLILSRLFGTIVFNICLHNST